MNIYNINGQGTCNLFPFFSQLDTLQRSEFQKFWRQTIMDKITSFSDFIFRTILRYYFPTFVSFLQRLSHIAQSYQLGTWQAIEVFNEQEMIEQSHLMRP